MGDVYKTSGMSSTVLLPAAGWLEFTRGASNLELRVDPNMPDLYEAHFEGITPDVRAQSGHVAITYPQSWNPFDWRRHSGRLTLNGSCPWRIEIRGGASHVEADLRRLRLDAFKVKGGASELDIRLPEPLGAVLFRIAQGASGITIRRPTGTPIRVRIGGGATQLTLDEHHFGAIGGETRWQSPDFAAATRYYDIVVERGASTFHVTAE